LRGALIYMEKQYREFAEECDRLAQEAKTDTHREILEEMAEAWRMLAAETVKTG
jgi:hypothetical protein